MAAQTVNVAELNLQQLDRFKSQLEEELQMLTTPLSQMKMMQTKLAGSLESLEHVTSANNGKSVLVPLTSSIYVPGKILTDKVLVDVGTGYFVEKDKEEAEKFFQRRIDYVTTNLEKIQQVLIDRHKLNENIKAIMLQKMQAQVHPKTI